MLATRVLNLAPNQGKKAALFLAENTDAGKEGRAATVKTKKKTGRKDTATAIATVIIGKKKRKRRAAIAIVT